ncbi:MAG: DUF177 domain-containing protein [Cyanobacteriota bacterium]|nr:DUF177 domain-containing protein [Cyanobacteriota bacterium]
MSPTPLTGPLGPISLMALARHLHGVSWVVNQPIAGLTTLTPVRGQIVVRHLGDALELDGQAEAIVTLCCDRCLQHFNHGLKVQQHELLDIVTTPAATTPAAGDLDLVPDERLDPRGTFDPERWFFEQLSLQQPTVNRCGPDCPGPPSWGDGHGAGDPRWASLGRLRPS